MTVVAVAPPVSEPDYSLETLPSSPAAFEAELAQRYRTILLFGAPGSGKGTIGKALGAIPGFVHVACGEVFRGLDLTSAIGKVFIEYSSKGLLVPDNTTIELWHQHIDALVATRRFAPDRDLLVLDGIPRNAIQAGIMDSYIVVERIFHLVCLDENLMFSRLRRRALKENRLDDASDEVIRHRWRIYEQESTPILSHYSSEIITPIDAIGTPVKVLHDILGKLL
ncbi:MAG: nucleoside monophosphate kinase [Cytophagales bacterium]|nr:nucleoside monophosphate kinase [Armatimonadota bacterium]